MTQPKTNRLWALILCLCLGLSLFGFSIPASAAATITEKLDFSMINSDRTGPGWSWNNATNTLTLNGIDLQLSPTDSSYRALRVKPDTEIVIVGENNIKVGSEEASSYSLVALYCPGSGAVKITGSGTLNLTSGDVTNPSSSLKTSYAIDTGALTIDGPTINATAGVTSETTNKAKNIAVNIATSDGLTINSGSLNATAQKGNTSAAIQTPKLKISGGEIHANSGGSITATSYGIHATSSFEMTGGIVTAEAGNAGTSSYGLICDGTSTFSGGTFGAKGETEAVHLNGAPTISEGFAMTGAATSAATDLVPVTYDESGKTYKTTDGREIAKRIALAEETMPITVSPSDGTLQLDDESPSCEFAYKSAGIDTEVGSFGLAWFADDTYTDEYEDGIPAGLYTEQPLSGGEFTIEQADGIPAAGTYYFKVYHSADMEGDGVYSNPCSITVVPKMGDLSDFTLTPGDGQLTVGGLEEETGYFYYYKIGTTEPGPDDKPAYGSTSTSGWTQLSPISNGTGVISATNGQAYYVQLVLMRPIEGGEPDQCYFTNYGVKSATPSAKSITISNPDGTLALGDADPTCTFNFTSTGLEASENLYVTWYVDGTYTSTHDIAPTPLSYEDPFSNTANLYFDIKKHPTLETLPGTYYFKVYNAAGDMPDTYSNECTLTVTAVPPTLGSVDFSLAAGNNQVTLTPPSDAGSKNYYYVVLTSQLAGTPSPAYGDNLNEEAWTSLSGDDPITLTQYSLDQGAITNGSVVWVWVAETNSEGKLISLTKKSVTPSAPTSPSKPTPVVKPEGTIDPVIEAGDSDQVSIPVNVSGASNPGDMQLTATIGGVQVTATPDANGDVIFNFPEGALNGLKEGEYDIVISFAGDSGNGAFSTTVGTLTVEEEEEFGLEIDVLAVRKGKALKLPKLKGYAGTWSVADDSVAKITKKGTKVKALALGTTKLLYTVESAPKKALVLNDRELKAGDTYEVTLNVRKRGQLVTKVKLDKKKLALTTVGANTTAKLTATVKKAKALDKQVFWTSSNPKVATVDRHGNVVAVGKGKCKITAVSTSLKRASATVTVKGAITVKPAKKSIKVGKELKLTATVIEGIDASINWTSSKPEIATVDKDGVVTAIAKGKATITATASNGETATCVVTVKKQ